MIGTMAAGRTAAAWQVPALGLVVFGVIAAGQALRIGNDISIGSDQRIIVFTGVQLLGGAIYLLAVVRSLARPVLLPALWLVLAIGLAMRLLLVFQTPFLSSDLFRYIWDGRVQLAGINPYLYIPADPELAWLRDEAIYPLVNRADYARTIYPPLAQLIFKAVATMSQTPVAIKLAMVAFELIGVAAVINLLRRAGQPRALILIYLWNPLPVWEFAGNGHVDGAAVGLLGLALLAYAHRRPALTGMAIAGAALVKFLPAVVLAAMWRRWDWRMPVAFVATIVILYAIYASAGSYVLGFLPAYAGEEGLSGGQGFWFLAALAKLVALPAYAAPVYLALAALALIALGLVMVLAPQVPAGSAVDIVRAGGRTTLLTTWAMIAISPHYPWYLPWLALPACLAPYRSTLYLTVAAFFLYLDPFKEPFFWRSLVYVPFLILAVIDLRRGPLRLPNISSNAATIP